MNTSMTWFTSDHYFGDEEVVRKWQRPFRDAHSMDIELIYRWNKVVATEDVVYYLGGFTLKEPEEWGAIASRLNGRKLLVPGNTDKLRISKRGEQRASGFEVLGSNVIITLDGYRLWLNHYPVVGGDPPSLARPAPPGEYDLALCGHLHSKWLMHTACINVGVDVWDFRPVSLQEMLTITMDRDASLTREELDA